MIHERKLCPSWASELGYLVFKANHSEGGHFAAYEQPERLAGDLRRMFGRDGPALGVIRGKDGYAS